MATDNKQNLSLGKLRRAVDGNNSYTAAASMSQMSGSVATSPAPVKMSDFSISAVDEGLSGFIHLFEPSSTTFVKHFLTSTQHVNGSGTPYSNSGRVAGYFNTTSAIDAIQFSMSSGNIDSGTIDMYGVL